MGQDGCGLGPCNQINYLGMSSSCLLQLSGPDGSGLLPCEDAADSTTSMCNTKRPKLSGRKPALQGELLWGSGLARASAALSYG